MIGGVVVRELRKNADDRGYLMELLRNDWPDIFTRFGQAYVSLNYPGVIRAWHYHKVQHDLFTCVSGMVKVPLHDAREGSPTKGETMTFVIGEDHPVAILIPPGVLHGYVTLGVKPSLLVNFPNEVYDAAKPDEFRVPHDDPSIGYDWTVRPR